MPQFGGGGEASRAELEAERRRQEENAAEISSRVRENQLLSEVNAKTALQNHMLEVEVKGLETQLEAARKYQEENAVIFDRLNSVLNSTSWKLIAPLRKLLDSERAR